METVEGARIALIGLGYVGLPLAVEFAKKYKVIGFDINSDRIKELRGGHDRTKEVDDEALSLVFTSACTTPKGLFFTDNIEQIRSCNYFIITLPTPVDKHNCPDLTPLYRASETVGKVLKPGDTVIYESTVYPGATEEECVPVLERTSGLKFNIDFFAGYSPERINPGDKEHTVAKILKVTSGSTPETAEKVDCLYRSVITAGTHKATSIKVAEAAKVVRNTKVVDILRTLQEYEINLTIYDPWAEPAEVKHEYGYDSVQSLEVAPVYDGIVLAVSHAEFKSLDLHGLCRNQAVIYDVKGVLPKNLVDARL